MSKKKEYRIKLQRKYQYYNKKYELSQPSTKGMDNKTLRKEIAIFKRVAKQVKLNKERERLQNRLREKNKVIGDKGFYSYKINIDINTVKEKKLPEVRKLINTIPKTRLKPDKYKKYQQKGKEAIKSILGVKKPSDDMSLNLYSKTIMDFNRKKANMLTSNEEVYYHNFLTALARVGATDLLKEVQNKGYNFAMELHDAGFNILEVYLPTVEDLEGNINEDLADLEMSKYSDAELEEMGFSLLNPTTTKHKVKKTQYGDELQRSAKVLLNRYRDHNKRKRRRKGVSKRNSKNKQP